jgi:hypothetical protein
LITKLGLDPNTISDGCDVILVALPYWQTTDTLRLTKVIAMGVVLAVRTAARHYGLKYAATELITALPRDLVYGVLALCARSSWFYIKVEQRTDQAASLARSRI